MMSQNVTLPAIISAAQARSMSPDAVYTSVQMLETHPKNCHFRHFSGLRRGFPAGRLAQQGVTALRDPT